MLYSDWNKWIIIRRMVSEKYAELEKAISSITPQTAREERIKYCKRIVRNLFPVKDMTEKQKKKWVDNISAVDLLFVYSLLNDVLRCFYYHCPMSVRPIAHNNDVIINYNLFRCGDLELSNATLYKKIAKNLAMFEYVSKIYDGKFDTINVPKRKDYAVELYNLEYRKSVVALLIEDALPRIREATKGQVADFNEAKKYFRLNSHQIVEGREPEAMCMGMLSVPNPAVDMLYGEDEMEITSHEVVGLDEFGHPITKDSSHQRYDHQGNPIDDDSYVCPIDD